MAIFIDTSLIKTSDYPSYILPVGSIAIDQAEENGDFTVKGFYDPKTGEFHIQEIIHRNQHAKHK